MLENSLGIIDMCRNFAFVGAHPGKLTIHPLLLRHVLAEEVAHPSSSLAHLAVAAVWPTGRGMRLADPSVSEQHTVAVARRSRE